MMSVKQRVAAISVAASGIMAALKLAIGIAIGSIALISDALHSVVDLIATAITWTVVGIADRPADAEHHYGHGKLESLSALGIVALLYVLAGGIVVEAFSRLRDGAPPPVVTALPFAVLVIEVAVNLWRARALHRTARKTRSHALAADSLHFTADVMGSIAVMAGLALTAFGFSWGDAAAAIAVATIISLLGLHLVRSTVETLLDRAPEGVAERAAAAIRTVPGVAGIERVRTRMVGSTHFVDAAVKVPRTYPIDRIEEIKRRAAAAVTLALKEADLTFTAVPITLDNESIRERIMVIARNTGLAIHHVTVHDIGTAGAHRKLAVSIDLELDADMPLAEAHDITHRLEAAICEEFGEHIEIDIHVEPLEPELPRGTDASADQVRRIQDALSGIASEQSRMHDVHNVRVRDTQGGQVVNFHCRAAPGMKVIEVHECVDTIERALRRQFPSVRRVIGHAEPDR